jgi:hypothetical protein
MDGLRTFLFFVLAVIPLMAGCSEAGPTITNGTVVVATDHMDVHFERVEPFEQTIMVFGGLETNQGDAISKVVIVGLSLDDARPIYARYPDFHMCKSAGAPLAQKATRQFDIVAASPPVQRKLRRAIAEHEASLRQGGERVCIKLKGGVLELTSARVRQGNEDVTDQLPPQIQHDYYLIESVERIPTQAAFAGM